jgi:hypothetical protein
VLRGLLKKPRPEVARRIAKASGPDFEHGIPCQGNGVQSDSKSKANDLPPCVRTLHVCNSVVTPFQVDVDANHRTTSSVPHRGSV